MATLERFETELPPDLAHFVHSRVGRGALASDSDVLREAMRIAAEAEAFQDAARQKIAAGMASLRLGKGVDGDTFLLRSTPNLPSGNGRNASAAAIPFLARSTARSCGWPSSAALPAYAGLQIA